MSRRKARSILTAVQREPNSDTHEIRVRFSILCQDDLDLYFPPGDVRLFAHSLVTSLSTVAPVVTLEGRTKHGESVCLSFNGEYLSFSGVELPNGGFSHRTDPVFLVAFWLALLS